MLDRNCRCYLRGITPLGLVNTIIGCLFNRVIVVSRHLNQNNKTYRINLRLDEATKHPPALGERDIIIIRDYLSKLLSKKTDLPVYVVSQIRRWDFNFYCHVGDHGYFTNSYHLYPGITEEQVKLEAELIMLLAARESKS